jgi:hypothetical protein
LRDPELFTEHEIEQLQASIFHLKERVTILQGDNHRLQIQAIPHLYSVFARNP